MQLESDEVFRTILFSVRRFAIFYSAHLHRLAETDKKILQRFAAHMPKVDDLTLVVLKGHLLLEEMLTLIISSSLPHPKLVRDVRLTFDRKVALSKALSWDQHKNHVWDLIGAINTVRNEMAHRLEPSTLHLKLKNLRALYMQHFPQDQHLTDEQLVGGAIGFSMGFLSRCISEATIFQRWIETLTKLGQRGSEA